MGCVRDEAKIYYGRDEISEGVSLLKDTGSETARFDWEIFECRGCGETPNATHGNTEEGAQCEELTKGIREPSTELENGTEKEVDHKRPFPSEAIR